MIIPFCLINKIFIYSKMILLRFLIGIMDKYKMMYNIMNKRYWLIAQMYLYKTNINLSFQHNIYIILIIYKLSIK